MSWCFEGMHITGLYMNKYPVSGKVWLSRVRYGGQVCHYINLDKPLELYGRTRDSLILDHREVLQVRDRVPETA